MGRPNGQTSHSRRVRVHWGGCQTPAGRRKASRENKATRKKNTATHRPGSRTSEAKQVEAKPAEAPCYVFLGGFSGIIGNPFVASVSPCLGLECLLTFRPRPIPGTGERADRIRARSCTHSLLSLVCPRFVEPPVYPGIGDLSNTACRVHYRAPALLSLEPDAHLSFELYHGLSRCLNCWPSSCSLVTACWQHRLTCGKAQESG